MFATLFTVSLPSPCIPPRSIVRPIQYSALACMDGRVQIFSFELLVPAEIAIWLPNIWTYSSIKPQGNELSYECHDSPIQVPDCVSLRLFGAESQPLRACSGEIVGHPTYDNLVACPACPAVNLWPFLRAHVWLGDIWISNLKLLVIQCIYMFCRSIIRGKSFANVWRCISWYISLRIGSTADLADFDDLFWCSME